MEGTPALICIPDITGFTEFMSDSKLESSSRLISSLLNKIIYANQIGLKVSEIEGDAILFYKSGDLPSIEKLLLQSQQFYTDFHKKLEEFSAEQKDNKDFSGLSDRLGLKIIMHYGQIGMVEVGSHLKLMGEDVIVAHRLLKNEVPYPEYVLFTEALMDHYNEKSKLEETVTDTATFTSDEYEHIGELPYYYMSFKRLEEINKTNSLKIK